MIESLVRIGVVTQSFPDRGTVKVHLTDVDDEISYELPVVYRKTLNDKDYWMPDIGEHVVCLFSGQGLEQGFILGAIYSDADAVPVSSQDKWHKTFEDGTVIEYDRAAHQLMANVQGDIEVTATGKLDAEIQGTVTVMGHDVVTVKSSTQLILQAPLINMLNITGGSATGTFTGNLNMIGNLNVQGTINASGTIIDGSGNTNHHSHP